MPKCDTKPLMPTPWQHNFSRDTLWRAQSVLVDGNHRAISTTAFDQKIVALMVLGGPMSLPAILPTPILSKPSPDDLGATTRT